MANTPEIDAPQAGFIVTVKQVSSNLYATQASAMGVYNVPAGSIKTTYAGFNVAYRRTAQAIDVTAAEVMAVIRGKIDNPKLTSWWFTLDGHDYFVLKLGTDGKTLVYDLSTEQWAWWSNASTARWRLNTGMNWRSAGKQPFLNGSNVVVGDDSYGVLWVLDPEKGADDDLLGDVENTFDRVATGQVASRARNFEPVYSVYLTANLGQPYVTANTVTLEYSDDQGHSYVVADEPQVSADGNYAQEFAWRSLGRMRAPGRLFRITDDGAFARIDGLDVNA